MCQGKGECANFIGFRKKFDSARLNEIVTAFIFCMNNFCCGSKFTEMKMTVHQCWQEGDNHGKPKNDQFATEKLADPEDRSCVYKLENDVKGMKKLKPGKAKSHWENCLSEPICTFMNWRLFLANFSVLFFEQNMLDAEQGIWNLWA